MDVNERTERDFMVQRYGSRDGDALLEPSYAASVRRFNARREEENRQAWAAFHESQAERHRRTLQQLVADHEHKAMKLLKGE